MSFFSEPRGEELSDRIKAYEEGAKNGFQLKTNEIPRELYLKRLSKVERENIAYLFEKISLMHRRSQYMVLAIGSITFNDEYWEELREYLEKNDPSKLGIVEKRGEDIDLLICPEDNLRPNPFDWITYFEKDLKRNNIKYASEYEKRDDGTSYLTVPYEFRKREGQSVLRLKSKDYISPALVVSFPNIRNIHLIFENVQCGEMKLKYERIYAYYFSLLFRHNHFWELKKTVSLLNEQEKML